MVGVVDDALNVRFDGAPGEAWTAKQVEARRDHSVAEMLEEWQQLSPAFEGALATLPFAMAGQALFDAVTHEHDIRCALHSPGGRDAPAVGVAFDWLVEMRRSVQAPAIRFDTDAGVMIAGTGDIVATIGAPRFEIVRATTGRRSASEIAAYKWDPKPDPSLLVGDGVLFHVRDEPLNE
jgi:hypothetical protein